MNSINCLQIQSLPTTFYGSPSMEKLYLYENFWYLKSDLQGVLALQNAKNTSPLSSKVVLATYPKCGTTWFKAMLFSIFNRSNSEIDLENCLNKHSPHDFAKWLEYYAYWNPDDPIPNVMNSNMKVPILSTHMAYPALPSFIKNSHCPIVYVCRNPKDVLVSLWHFLNKMKGKETEDIKLEEAFECFSKGVSHFGPFWSHCLSYWHASKQYPEKIFFVRYEDMMAFPVEYISRLANFVGHPFSAEEEKEGVREMIIELCSFKKMTSFAANKAHDIKSITPSLSVSNNMFFRTGKVGDFHNHLTKDMIDALDHITEEKLKGSGLIL